MLTKGIISALERDDHRPNEHIEDRFRDLALRSVDIIGQHGRKYGQNDQGSGGDEKRIQDGNAKIHRVGSFDEIAPRPPARPCQRVLHDLDLPLEGIEDHKDEREGVQDRQGDQRRVSGEFPLRSLSFLPPREIDLRKRDHQDDEKQDDRLGLRGSVVLIAERFLVDVHRQQFGGSERSTVGQCEVDVEGHEGVLERQGTGRW